MSNPYRKIAAFTNPICRTICRVAENEEKYRCCDKIFCEMVRKDLPKGVHYAQTGHEIPFMGKNGCVVKPEHRPFCAAFLCPGIKVNQPALWKKYIKLCKKYGIRPPGGQS